MTKHNHRIEGRLHLVVRRSDGAVVGERRASNTVLRSGAELVADLFGGQALTPINGIAVGLDSTPSSPPYEAAALTTTTPEGEPALLRTAAALPAEAIETEILADELKVRVRVRGVIPEDHAAGAEEGVERVLLGEAALGVLAADGESLERIYNRVVFEPVPKTQDHELALYWEVDFPYGV